MIDEKGLATTLHDVAGRDDAGPPPIDTLLRRGRRARYARLGRIGGATLAAVALTAGLAAVAAPDEPGVVPLQLAAQTTARTTFRFDRVLTSPIWNLRSHGAVDPTSDRGYQIFSYEGESPPTDERRQIGDSCYVTHDEGRTWLEFDMSKSSMCWRPADTPEGAALGVSAKPGDLLAELQTAGQVSYEGRTGKGRQKVDTYRFTYRWQLSPPPDTTDFERRGTVDVEVATHRIVHLAYRDQDVTGGITSGGRMAGAVDLRFSQFGAPVVVERPRHAVKKARTF